MKINVKLDDWVGNVDFSVVENAYNEVVRTEKPVDIETFSKCSGLPYFDEIIRKHLGKYSEQYFFEYSIITSMLNPSSEKLLCFSAVRGNNSFKDNVQKYVKHIIDIAFPKGEENYLFNNPALFWGAENIADSIYLSECGNNSLYNENIRDEIKEAAERIIPNPYFEVKEKEGGFYVSNMTYDRLFSDSVKYCKSIYTKYNGNEKVLLEKYHMAADKLRTYYDNILLTDSGEKYYYLTFPFFASRNKVMADEYEDIWGKKSNRYQGFGNLFLYFKANEDFREKASKICSDLFREINDLARGFSLIFTFNTGLKIRQKVKHNAIKSAIGSIMSRNGSHNIGSHVLASLTHNVGSMPDDRILYQYIQQRMDYIANVTTDPPGWSVPTMFVGDIMKTFFSQRNLLEYIAGSEGLCAYKFQDPNMGKEERIKQTDTIKIHIRRIAKGICQKSRNNDLNHLKHNWDCAKKAGENALHIIPYPGIHFIDYQEDKPLQLEYDAPLAIPGGVVGEHAIFTILENFIRNAAKHGWSVTRNQRKKQKQEQENVKEKGQEQNLEIYIDFIDDPGKDDVEFTIWDNMSDVFAAFRTREDIPLDKENGAETREIWSWDPDKCARFISALPEDQTRFDADLYLLCRIYVLAVKKQEISEMLSREANMETETENRLSRKLDEINKELNRLQQKIGQQTNKQALFGLVHAFTEAGTNTDPPVRIEEIRRDIQTGIRKIDKLFEEKLLEKPNDNEIASLKKIPDLDMPLHFRQQILLNEPLINDDGRLRRENWGLAEMKISACYLQNRPLGEVGGLEPLKKTDDYVIFPVAMPGVCKYSEENGGIRCEEKQKQCTEKDCPIETKRYHLGFRFKVPKPREILIVLNKEKDLEVVTDTNNPKVSKYKENGIYFTSSEVLCSKDKDAPVEDFDFDYVVFLNKRSAQDCGNSILEKRANQNGEEKPPTDIEAIWKSYFPIRLLTKDVLKDITLTEPEKAIPVIKEKVYAAWLEKIRNSRKSESRTNAITLQLKTTDNKKKTNNASGSQGLTTDKDVLRFVFQNNFHSILANLLEKPPVEMDCFSELILYLLKACPEPDKEIPASNEGPETVIRKTLRNLCRKLKEALCPDLEKTDDESKMSSDSISERIDPKAVVFLNTIKSEYNDLLRAKLVAFCPLKKTERKPGDVSEVLVQSIQNAFNTCKTILCKHEESIHTLPHGYSVATCPEPSEQSDKSESSIISADFMWNELGQPVDPLKGLKEKLARLNITIVGEENKEGINIKYCRHNDVCSKGCLYAEALSGSQSYLNILSRIMHPVKGSQDNPENHIGMFVRLVENAFLRLLIIDERVLKFLKSHSDISKRFQSMNIDVADFSDTPVAAQDGRMLYPHALDLFFRSNQEKVDNEQNSGDVNINVQAANKLIPVGKNNSLTNEWDLLIIHQGIIDKWFPNSHSKESVGKLIQNIQKSGVCKHVIITSGRGRPNNIPGYVKMIPFSMLESTLFRNYPEKLTLVTAAMNALPNKTGI